MTNKTTVWVTVLNEQEAYIAEIYGPITADIVTEVAKNLEENPFEFTGEIEEIECVLRFEPGESGEGIPPCHWLESTGQNELSRYAMPHRQRAVDINNRIRFMVTPTGVAVWRKDRRWIEVWHN